MSRRSNGLASLAPVASADLSDIVEELASERGPEPSLLRQAVRPIAVPSRDTVIELVEALRSVLFPGYFGDSTLTRDSLRFHLGSTLDRVRRGLKEQVLRGMCFECDDASCTLGCDERAEAATLAFLARLPAVRRLLALDTRAAYEGDPACKSLYEPVFCYPGMLAVTSYRIAHELANLGVPLIPRIITEHAHSVTGIDIHPGAIIGESFFIDHGTGVVIGETCIIGDRVKIYQGVTLGARSFPLDTAGRPVKGIARHPVVEDNVTIYSGATILGRVHIGQGSVIGGNVWLTHSVPPGSNVYQQAARQEHFSKGSGI